MILLCITTGIHDHRIIAFPYATWLWSAYTYTGPWVDLADERSRNIHCRYNIKDSPSFGSASALLHTPKPSKIGGVRPAGIGVALMTIFFVQVKLSGNCTCNLTSNNQRRLLWMGGVGPACMRYWSGALVYLMPILYFFRLTVQRVACLTWRETIEGNCFGISRRSMN